MKVGMVIVMIVFGTLIGAIGKLWCTTVINHLMDKPLFFKGAQRTVQGDAIQPVEVFFDIGIGQGGLPGFQEDLKYFIPYGGDPQAVLL